MYIRVTRSTPDQLRQEVFTFVVNAQVGADGIRVHLSSWCQRCRPSKRHRNWQLERQWSATNLANSYLSAVRPVVPEDVRVEVLERLRAEIRFVD